MPAKRAAKSKAKPVKASKAKSAKPAKAKAGKTAKGKAPTAKAGKGRPARPAAATREKERTHCIATDPFGDPCQSAPRLPSKYCTIHSYLDR